MAAIVDRHFPWSYAAFEDYHLNAITLTAPEIDMLRETLTLMGDDRELLEFKMMNNEGFSTREADEFAAKLLKLGLQVDVS
jgi:hypothetical protein